MHTGTSKSAQSLKIIRTICSELLDISLQEQVVTASGSQSRAALTRLGLCFNNDLPWLDPEAVGQSYLPG